MENESEKKEKKLLAAGWLKGKGRILAAVCAAIVLALGFLVSSLLRGNKGGQGSSGTELLDAFWPESFIVEAYDEPEFIDDPARTNNAFNVIDFGEQGSNGWFYRCGDYKRPERSERASLFDGEKYYHGGATGLEIKNNFVHTADKVSPILEWRAAEDGKVNVIVTYVKNVNGDANPSYPDGVQLLVYKGKELLGIETVPISVTEENFAQIKIDDLEVKELESLYFVVNPMTNNAYDGGSFYVAISDVNAKPSSPVTEHRSNNNANSVEDFGRQGSNGWTYMYGTSPADSALVSHEKDGEYLNCTSPSLSIKKDFIHPSLNHNAILAWTPAVSGNVDLRIRYTKFEQNDGNPDFPDGVIIRAYKNNQVIYEKTVDVPDTGSILVKHRIPSLKVSPSDKLYFMVDPNGNSSYDGGSFDVTIIDINGATNESSVKVTSADTRQNIANVMTDFGPQGTNGWIYQWGYEDDPFHAYNMTPFDRDQDRYFNDSWIEIKRDYVNTGEHDRSAIIKWRVAQNGTISIRASYTKMPNEDANPSWPDGTRVTLYHNGNKLTQQTFDPVVGRQVTKRLDVSSVKVKKDDYITMVINGINNNAYDGGKYEFAINSLSGLVGNTEKNVPATYNGRRTNNASTLDDFGKQGYNGFYYQYGYNHDPFNAVNIENCENNEKYYTSDGVEIKKDYIVPGPNGKSANVKWVAAEDGKINIDLLYTKLKNEDKNPSYPDGVTVYLMKNGTVLKKQYFAALTDREVTGDLSTYGVNVKKGDCITMIVDPGNNSAYDGGKYLFVIEDANAIPKVGPGNNDNETSLADLTSLEQGTDGWWFLEGNSLSDAKVLTKKIDNNTGYGSRRTEGLVIKKDTVHPGAAYNPIYQWVAGQDGKIDIAGTYLKYGQEDSNPSWPDGVTLKIWHNNTLLLNKKVNVLRGDGNNNTLPFSFNKLNVKRGDKISFMICRDGNNAWDGGQLTVSIEPSSTLELKPGDDNSTVLGNLQSIEQGTDGWYFMEGTSLADAKPLTKMNDDKSAYISAKDMGLEMKKDYVHPGTNMNPIYRWVVKDDGKINVSGRYTKFGHNDGDPSAPDGITLTIYHNDKVLAKQKVEVKQGDGNDTVYDFAFNALEVKANDILSFQISPDNNNRFDAGRLTAVIMDASEDEPLPDPDRDNNTVLAEAFGEQGNDGWFFGSCAWDGTGFAKLPFDEANNRYYAGEKPELKADFVEPGAGKNAAYKWIVAKDGTIHITGEYVKFANNADPNADGTCMRIFLNGQDVKWYGGPIQGNFDSDQKVAIDETLEVKAGDVLIFAIDPEGNDSYDGGRLSIKIADPDSEPEPEPEPEPDPDRTNNTVLKDDFTERQGGNGWYYGAADWDSKNFTMLPYDEANSRYCDNGNPELKADYVHPGSRNAAYKWIVAEDGSIHIDLEYEKFANNADPNANGTCLRVFLNGEEKQWIGGAIQGNFAENKTVTWSGDFDVKAGDEVMFTVDADGNESYDGGRLAVTISGDSEEPSGETYGVTYKYDKEYPEAVMNTLPKDDKKYATGKKVTAIAPTETVVTVTGEEAGTYTFAGWDAESKTVADADVEFTGSWTFEAADPERTNNTVLKDDFSGTQGKNGWSYGSCEWDGKDFQALPYDEANSRYYNNGKPELKADFVEPGSRNAAYKWAAAEDGSIHIDLEYEKFANSEDPNANGTCLRVFLNGEEKQWIGGDTQGNFAENKTVTWSGDFDVKAGDEVMFTVDADRNDSYDGGRLAVTISDNNAEPSGETYGVTYKYDKEYSEAVMNTLPKDEQKYETGKTVTAIAPTETVVTITGEGTYTFAGWDAESKTVADADVEFTGSWTFEAEDPARTNNTVLKDDFSGTQGKNGWSYGSCEWDGKDFQSLPYDEANSRYYNNGKPELKADFVEPGNGRNAAYKWVAAEDGDITVEGTYTKFANSDDPNADGTSVRIVLNGTVKKWMGTQGNFSEEQTVTFNESYTVKKGDEIIFAVNPEDNDSYDGGRLEVTIKAKSAEPAVTYGVTYKYDKEYPEAVMNTLPKDEQKYETGASVTAIAPTETTVTVTGEEAGTYTFAGWDAESKTVADADVEFTGSWTFEADETVTYGVTYKYDKEYPEAVMNTLPKDEQKYETGASVTAIAPTETAVTVTGEEAGTYTFNGWDAESKTVADADVEFTGSWTFEADETVTYGVTYKYDKEYPEAVMNTLPKDEQKYETGKTVTAIAPAETEVKITSGNNPGIYTFNGWDAESKTVEDADVEFTGSWTFKELLNHTVLKDDFSGTQGQKGWYYGACDWDGKNFRQVGYDSGAYKDGALELKADFVHPGDGPNAAYRWVAQEDGDIRVRGSYVKFANSADPNADGTCVRIVLNGTEKKYMGAKGNYTEDQTVEFNEEYTVKKGDEIIFAINPEGNNSYDGGRLSVEISPR